jgi:GPI mannosyltransferase 1 subunit M
MAAAAAVTLRRVMLASAVLRLALVVFGEWQDDAAASVASGGSPFAQETYRYSPLLAFLLLPNSLLHAAWGKLIFSAAGKPTPLSRFIGS